MRIYIIVMVCAMYVAGLRVGAARCRAVTASAQIQTQIQIIREMEKINAETLHTTVRDIRRGLREKYTIAE